MSQPAAAGFPTILRRFFFFQEVEEVPHPGFSSKQGILWLGAREKDRHHAPAFEREFPSVDQKKNIPAQGRDIPSTSLTM